MSATLENTESLVAPSPVSGWRRLVIDWCVVSASTLACQVLGAVTSLALRFLLDPASMGIWQTLKLVLSYGNYTNLGISKGATREYTVAVGRGDEQAARRGLNLAFTLNTISSLAYGGILVGVGGWLAVRSGPWAGMWALGCTAVGLFAALQRYVTFQVTILRARQDFGVTARLSLLEGILTVGLGTPATWLWGLPGLLGATLAVLLGSLVYVHRHGALALRPAWDRSEMRRLVGIGGPMLLVGVLYSLLRSVDKLLILACLDQPEFQLGCYSLALMVTTQLYGLGNMLAIVVGPRLAEKYGQAGERSAVASLAGRMSELVAATVALPAALALVAGEPLLARLLPAYRPGLAPMVWLVPGVVPLVLSLPASQYLMAVDRQNRALGAVVVAVLATAILGWLALACGGGLAELAAATSAGYGIYWLVVAGVSLGPDLDTAGRVRYLTLHALALTPLAVALAIRLLAGNRASVGQSAAATLAVVAAWSACAAVGWRRGGWAALASRSRSR